MITFRRLVLGLILLHFANIALCQSWKYVAPMRHARGGHRALLLNSGKILVIGGQDGTEALRSCELYDPTTNTWTEADSMNTPRYRFSAFLLSDGRVFVAGGLTIVGINPGTITTESCEIYDPISNKWRYTTSMSTPREGYEACQTPNDKIFILGGLNANTGTYLSACELFDARTETMSALPPLPSFAFLSTALFDSATNSVIIPGGNFNGFGGYILSSTQKFSITDNRWLLLDSMIERQGGYHNTIADPNSGKIIVAAGQLDYNGNETSRIESLNPGSGHWKSNGTIDKRWDNHATLVRDSILVTGGITGIGTLVSDCWWYNPETDQTHLAPPLLDAETDQSPVYYEHVSPEDRCLNTRIIYVFGGRTSRDNFHNRCEALNLGEAPKEPSIVLIPSLIKTPLSPCHSSLAEVTFSGTGCNAVYLTDAFLEDSSRVLFKRIHLPLLLSAISLTDTLEVPQGSDSTPHELTFIFRSAGEIFVRHISVEPSGSITHAFNLPQSIALGGSVCNGSNDTFEVRNLGCDSLVLDSLLFSSPFASMFSIKDQRVVIPPGSDTTLELYATSTMSGNFSAVLHCRFRQYGTSWDTVIPILYTVSNLQPYYLKTILKDAKDVHPGDTIEMPLYLISNLSNATSCEIELHYNTNILQQVDPNLSGTLLQGISVYDWKERNNNSVLRVPVPFAMNNNRPFVKFRFRVLLGDTAQSSIYITRLDPGTNTIPANSCLAFSQDSALVTLSYQCGDPLLSNFMRTNVLGPLLLERVGGNIRASIPAHSSIADLEVYDLMGRKILAMSFPSVAERTNYILPNGTNSGIFFGRLFTSEGIRDGKVSLMR